MYVNPRIPLLFLLNFRSTNPCVLQYSIQTYSAKQSNDICPAFVLSVLVPSIMIIYMYVNPRIPLLFLLNFRSTNPCVLQYSIQTYSAKQSNDICPAFVLSVLVPSIMIIYMYVNPRIPLLLSV